MWNLKYDTNEHTCKNRNRLTDIEDRLVVAEGEGWRGMEWEFGVSRCKLVYKGWVNNKIPIAQGTIFNIL